MHIETTMDWSEKKRYLKERAAKTRYYEFRRSPVGWTDVANPERCTIDEIFSKTGASVPADYVNYCLMETCKCSIKYRRCPAHIAVYIEWL